MELEDESDVLVAEGGHAPFVEGEGIDAVDDDVARVGSVERTDDL